MQYASVRGCPLSRNHTGFRWLVSTEVYECAGSSIGSHGVGSPVNRDMIMSRDNSGASQIQPVTFADCQSTDESSASVDNRTRPRGLMRVN